MIAAYVVLCIVGCTFLLSWLLSEFLGGIGMIWLKKHRVVFFGLCFALLFGGLTVLSDRAPVYCPPEYEAQFDDELRQEISELSKREFPFFAYDISILSIEDEEAVWEVKYLFLGNTVRTVGPDGADTIKRIGKQ